MNVLVLLLLLAPLVSSPQAAGTGTIEGTVVLHDSSQPAASARVILRSDFTDNSPRLELETTAGSAGKFLFTNLRPGRYLVSTEDPRFTRRMKSGDWQRPLVVSGQAAVANLIVGRTGSLRGRVSRPDGQPLIGGSVHVLRPTYAGQQIILQSNQPSVEIDRNGFYRVPSLDSGEYYVFAYGALGQSYFPDSPNASRAGSVTVGEGAEAIADILFRPDPTVKVSGRISLQIPDAENYELTEFYVTRRNTRIRDDVPRLELAATITGSPGRPERNVSATFSDSGRLFEIPRITTGSYDIFAILSRKWVSSAPTAQGTVAVMVPSPRLIARTSVEVGATNVENVLLVPRPGVALTGRVLGPSPEKTAAFRISLRPYDNAPAAAAAAVFGGSTGLTGPESDGRFSFQNVTEGLYALNLTGLPSGTYVSDIQQNGQSLGPSGLLVGTQDDNSIEVIIKDMAGTVRGSVQNQAAVRPGASVVLVPEPSLRWNDALYRTTSVSASGDFVIDNIAPGDYKLFAFEIATPGSAVSPGFISRYESRGTAITVQPGATITTQVPAIPWP